MNEGKRQKQVANEIARELNDIFVKRGLTMMEGGMVSISNVKVTPDLMEARIYLSLFQIKDQEAVLDKFRNMLGEIRGDLGKRMRHQLRVIPHLTFFGDETLDEVFKIEKLLNEIKKDEKE